MFQSQLSINPVNYNLITCCLKSLNHSESKNPEEGLLESSKWRDRVKLDILQRSSHSGRGEAGC